MFNKFLCVGRICNIKTKIDDTLVIQVCVSKNIQTVPSKDLYIDLYINNKMQDSVLQYSAVGDLIGAQGSLINDYEEHIAVLVEKYTCLTKKGGEENGTR